MGKWIVMALAAAALGFAGCGDDDDGDSADCMQLASCLAGCGLDEAEQSCSFGCMEKHSKATSAFISLGACQSEHCGEAEDPACLTEHCSSQLAACGLEADDFTSPAPIGDDADCAEAEFCTGQCQDSEDPNCLLDCTDVVSLGAYSSYLSCSATQGCMDDASGDVDRACAEENCPAEYAACNF